MAEERVLEAFRISCEHLRVRTPNQSLRRILTRAVITNEIVIDTYIGNRNIIVAAEVASVALPQLTAFRVPESPLYNSEDKPNSVSGNTAVQTVCALFARHPSLHTLDFSSSTLGTIALIHIAELARVTPSLRDVPLSELSRKEADPDQLALLLALLQTNVRKGALKVDMGLSQSTQSASYLSGSRQSPRLAAASQAEAVPPPPPTLTHGVGVQAIAVDLARRLHLNAPSEKALQQQQQQRAVKMTRPVVSLPYEYAAPHRLSLKTMRCIQEHSKFTLDELPVRLPPTLAHLNQGAARDGTAAPPQRALPSTNGAHPRKYPKTPEERARLHSLIVNSSLYRSFQLEIFPGPPPPGHTATVRSVSQAPNRQQVDYEMQVSWMETQRDELLKSLIDSMHLSLYHTGDALSELHDSVTRVYLIDSTLSPNAVVEHWGRPASTSAGLYSEGNYNNDATTTSTSSSSSLKLLATYGAGQWAGAEELIPVDSSTPPPTKRQCTLIVRSHSHSNNNNNNGPLNERSGSGAAALLATTTTTSSNSTSSGVQLNPSLARATSSSMPSATSLSHTTTTSGGVASSSPVYVWELSGQSFQTLFAEPIFRHRTEWRRLADAMPSLLGTDVLLRAAFADVLHATSVGTFRGDDGIDEHVILTPAQLKDYIVVVEEGQLELFAEDGTSLAAFSRGSLVSISAATMAALQPPPEWTLKTVSGGLPSWRCTILSKEEDVRRKLPLELQELLLVKKEVDMTGALEASAMLRDRMSRSQKN